MKKITLIIVAFFSVVYSKQISAQNFNIFGFKGCACDTNWFMGYNYITGLADTINQYQGNFVIPNYDRTSDPYNSRLFYYGGDTAINGFVTLDVSTFAISDTDLIIFDDMQYDAFNNRILFIGNDTLFSLDLFSFSIQPICTLAFSHGVINAVTSVFNPINQQFIYAGMDSLFGSNVIYVTVDIDSAKIIDTTLIPLPQFIDNIVFDPMSGNYYGYNWPTDSLVSFDPITGNHQNIALLPSSFYNIYNKENAVFDYNNNLYILPYGDMAGNRWCDAMDATNGSVIYHSPFPGFDMGQIFNTSQPILRLHNGSVQTVYAMSYQWYLDGNPLPGEIQQTVVPSVSGLYKCLVTSFNSQSSFSVEKNIQVTGIDKPSNDDILFTATPNPAHSDLEMMFNLVQNSHLKIEITNLPGLSSTLLFEGEISRGITKKKFSIAELAAGAYFVKVTSKQQSVAKKIIKLN